MEKFSRPRFLNLLQISFPATAILSILHRISGVVLTLYLPLSLVLFERSLLSADSFQQLPQLWDVLLVRLLVVAGLWALSHHMISGVRILLLDFGVGIAGEDAQRSAYVVAGASISTLLWILWGLV